MVGTERNYCNGNGMNVTYMYVTVETTHKSDNYVVCMLHNPFCVNDYWFYFMCSLLVKTFSKEILFLIHFV